ncbi:hypothetical protein N0V85_007437 [Neurospora sp. IMI 360204]|nr:hypothetical protein N0V85_007437 [Neurospora sp. IMI 360204]
MARIKYVKERIGEEITDWSQLLHRRQRREERRRLKELEHQKELERRRETGEITQDASVPANIPAHIPTNATNSATLNPSATPATRATTTPITRRVTRAAARAATNAATPDTTTATTATADIDTTTAPASAPTTAQTTSTAATLPTVIAMAVEEEEHGDMGMLDPALFEPVNDMDVNVPQLVLAPTVVKETQNVEPIARRASAGFSPFASVQAASIPANLSTIAANAVAYAPATAPAYAPAIAPTYAPITVPATGRATACEAEENVSPKLSEPVTSEDIPEQVVVPSGDKERRSARIAAAAQLVPVAKVINRLFAESLERLLSPTPEVVSAEARRFLANAHENETEQAVKKAAFTLSFHILDKINELQGQNRFDRFEVASEVLKLKLQQVFLKELVK